MNRKKIEETVEQLVEDIIEGAEIEIVDVEYVKERDWYLRVFLDKENGIELDDCQWISERLEENLDRLDLIKDQYYLEISSPGLDRQLKKEKDFARHVGDMVEIKLYRPLDGAKNIVGTLLGLRDGVICLKDAINAEQTGKGKKGRKEKKPAEPAQTPIPACPRLSPHGGMGEWGKEIEVPWNEAASVRLHIDF